VNLFFHKSRQLAFVTFVLSAWTIMSSAGEANLPDDEFLYYRRTHQGAWPPPGVDPSDHSGETTNTVPAPKPAPPVQPPGPLLDNGVDPANLGKGDWIWQMPATQAHLGVANVQGVIDYEKNLGMQWITVKCGDAGNIWTQFNPDLIARAHAAGLKVFGWAYAYGNNSGHYGNNSGANVSGEINVALNALALGADGFIIDAEIEYETNATRQADAALYASTIKSNYPTRFLAHAPFPYINSHPGFPYIVFGTNCDAVMPQDYWGAIGVSPQTMVVNMNSKWITWQNSLTGNNTNAIKPIVPLGQSYAPVTGAEIAAFLHALQTNSPKATPAGYNGVSFWDAQERTSDMDAAILNAAIGTNGQPPFFASQPLSRLVDTGGSVSLACAAGGTTPLNYQWLFNAVKVSAATNSTLTLSNTQTTNSGNYSLIVTNSFGSVTSSAAWLLVYSVQAAVFSDTFDANTAANWTFNKSSADTRVIFNYDYSTMGIPSAPNSTGGTTRGLRMEANLTAEIVAALSLSPIGQSFAGDHRLRFDMWINANGPFPAGGGGSTEFLTAGIGTAGDRVEWTGNGTTADGFYFSADGEGGLSDTSTTSGDYCAYIGTALQSTSTGIYVAGTDSSARGNLNVFYQTVFPTGLSAPVLQQANYPANQTGAMNAGTVGFAWHDVIISRRGSMVDWAIDGIRMATISSATFTASNVFVGYWDPFSSLSDNTNLSFGLVDNVRVEVPAIAPTISLQPTNLSVKLTSNATFTVTAAGLPAPSYQWRFNNTNISGATVSSYTRTNAQPGDVGNYSVVITNIAGSLASSNAALTLIPPAPAQFQLVSLQPDRSLRIVFNGDPAWTYTVETSTNLIHWSTLTNLTSASGVFDFIAGSTTNDTQRFYRARSGP
jgi:hypothetical protein